MKIKLIFIIIISFIIYNVCDAVEKLKLEAGKVDSFNLQCQVIKIDDNFFYELFFYQWPDSILFVLTDNKLKEFADLLYKAKNQMEELKISNIEKITIEVGRFEILDRKIHISIVKDPELLTKVNMRLYATDKYGFNTILIHGYPQILIKHIDYLKEKMNELKSINIKFKD